MENIESSNSVNNGQDQLPYSTSVLVLGILSIVCCFCYGVVGLVLGIIALYQSKKANILYLEEPAKYTKTSASNLKAGKVCAIIGVCLSGLMVLYFAIIMLFYGTLLANMPWEEILDQRY